MARPELSRAYGQFLEVATTLLYEFRSHGVGRSIDAPADEYRDLATLLVPPLSAGHDCLRSCRGDPQAGSGG